VIAKIEKIVILRLTDVSQEISRRTESLRLISSLAEVVAVVAFEAG